MIGTAGHIDHGKTTLVRALTGHETDRHPEEKARGITIELGFAPWALAPDLELSIVDVPGHEAFVRTMIAGAAGLDLVILVVSAEDGVMPQTREHLAICRLLGVRRGVVALSKIDLLEDDPDALELAVEDVRAALAEGIFAEAPIVPVSASTGAGLDALGDTVAKALRELPARPRDAAVRLPIDRAFTMKGHGTVMTGTLLSGTLELEDSGPAGPELRVMHRGGRPASTPRLRGIQVRNAATARARAGSRVALNLGGIGADELHRGDLLASPEAAVVSDTLHAWVDLLPHADAPLAHPQSVQLCIGTAHAAASVDVLALEDGDGLRGGDGLSLAPGRRGLLRLRLDEPLPIWWGQRLVLRAFHAKSAKMHGLTVAGGRVVDPQPSSGRAQRARWVEVAEALRGPDASARALALVLDAGLSTLDDEALQLRAGIERPRGVMAPLVSGEDAPLLLLGDGHYVAREELEALVPTVVAKVDAFHDAQPLASGISRGAVEAALPPMTTPTLARAVTDLALERGALRLADGEGSLARPGRGQLDPDALPPELEAVLELYRARGSTPPTLREVAGVLGVDAKEALERVVSLQRSELLVRVSDDLSWSPEAHAELVESIRAHLRTHGEIDVQGLKALAGLSRKFAVPVLEQLDRLGITRRQGDRRVPGPKL